MKLNKSSSKLNSITERKKVSAGTLIYSAVPEQDLGLTQLLKRELKNIKVVTTYKNFYHHFITLNPSVLIISADKINDSLNLYDKFLENINVKQTASHKCIVCCYRREEEVAYKAYLEGIIDDYLVSKPLYEKYRAISIVKHMFLELGNSHTQSSTANNIVIDEELQSCFSHCREQKSQVNQRVNKTVSYLESRLDLMLTQIEAGEFSNSDYSINFQHLRAAFQQFKADDMRASMQHLQEKIMMAFEVLSQKLGATGKVSTNEERFNTQEERSQEIKDVERDFAILMVDDDANYLEILCKQMEGKGFNIRKCFNSTEALGVMLRDKFDAIVMDLHLPDKDGLFTVTEMKQFRSINRDTPVILLTSSSDEKDVKRAINAKVQSYMVKPVKINSLIKKIHTLIQRSNVNSKS